MARRPTRPQMAQERRRGRRPLPETVPRGQKSVVRLHDRLIWLGLLLRARQGLRADGRDRVPAREIARACAASCAAFARSSAARPQRQPRLHPPLRRRKSQAQIPSRRRHEDDPLGASRRRCLDSLHEGRPWALLVDTIRPDTELVCLCESETDADALAERGQTAIAVAYGAGKPVTQAQAKFLEGKAVAIMEHRDDAGANFAAACRDVLYAVANEVFAVLAPEPYKDVRDWILAEFPEPDEISGLSDAARAANAQYAPPEVAETLLQDLIPPLDYIIQPLLSIGNLTLLQGEPKAGKSTFALYLALCASLGRWPSGRFVAGVPTRTLFISWEDGRRRIRERLENYLRGLCEKSETPPPLDNLYIYASSTAPRIRLDPDSPSGKKTIRRLLKMTGAQLLFLDTFSHLSSKNENAKEDMQPVVDALRDILREFDVSIMLSHHTGKPSEKNPKSSAYRSRGSSVIAAAADCILDWGSRGSTNTTPCEFISDRK